MIKIKTRERIREERRKDEESLYYIIERDLDRGAIFLEHDGWLSQVSMDRRIDYLVRYKDKAIGIEIKSHFPKLKHFEQVAEYKKFLDAVFLAYPSDWAAEALFISESKDKYTDVGLLSIALYRSHIIRPAKCEMSIKQWYKKGDYFEDENSYFNWVKERKNENLDKYTRIVKAILHDYGVYTSVDKDGKYYKDDKPRLISITPKEWKTLAALYALSIGKSIFRYFSWDKINTLMRELKWGSPILSGLLEGNMIVQYSYGDDYLYRLNDQCFILKKELKIALKEKLGNDEFNKMQEVIKNLIDEHKETQRKQRRNFLIS